jgi:hypothetical protein
VEHGKLVEPGCCYGYPTLVDYAFGRCTMDGTLKRVRASVAQVLRHPIALSPTQG